MSNGRPLGNTLFSGAILTFVGVILLLHHYRGLDLRSVLFHWWPLILIGWGALKLFERTLGSRSGESGGARITPGEVFLVLGLMALIGAEVITDNIRGRINDWTGDWGNTIESDLEVAPV